MFRKCWKDKKNRQESLSIIPAKTKLSFMKTNASECRNMTRCICMPPSLHTQKQQDIPRFTTANQFLNRGPSLYHLLDHPSATCLPTNRILFINLYIAHLTLSNHNSANHWWEWDDVICCYVKNKSEVNICHC